MAWHCRSLGRSPASMHAARLVCSCRLSSRPFLLFQSCVVPWPLRKDYQAPKPLSPMLAQHCLFGTSAQPLRQKMKCVTCPPSPWRKKPTAKLVTCRLWHRHEDRLERRARLLLYSTACSQADCELCVFPMRTHVFSRGRCSVEAHVLRPRPDSCGVRLAPPVRRMRVKRSVLMRRVQSTARGVVSTVTNAASNTCSPHLRRDYCDLSQ